MKGVGHEDEDPHRGHCGGRGRFRAPWDRFGGTDTVYCINGVSTTLPTSVGFTGGSATLTEGSATPIISLTGGTFYAGDRSGGRSFVSTEPLDPGYSTNFVSLGSCTAFVPSITYVSVCKYLIRADGKLGFSSRSRCPTGTTRRGSTSTLLRPTGWRGLASLATTRRAWIQGDRDVRGVGWQARARS